MCLKCILIPDFKEQTPKETAHRNLQFIIHTEIAENHNYQILLNLRS